MQEWPGCSITRMEGKDELLTALRSHTADLVISEFSLQSYNGLDVLTQAHALCADVPFLFLTRADGEGRIVDALQQGAADYVHKDRVERLVPAIQRALENAAVRSAKSIADKLLQDRMEAVDGALDAICIASGRGHLTYANVAARDMFALDESPEVEPRSLDALFGPQNRSILSVAINELHSTGAWSGELSLTPPGAQARFIVSRWTLIKDAQNRPKAILAINTNITGHKELERHLLPPRKQDGLGTLATGIAHDLQRILQPMLTASAALQRSVKQPEILRLADIIDASTRHVLALFHQLRTYAHSSKDERMEVQVGSSIQEVVQLLRQSLAGEINIETVIQKDLWTVAANPMQLTQVLINLGIQARDAIASSGILTFRASNVAVDEALAQAIPGAQSGPHVLITVSHTGTGIPPELIDQVLCPRLPGLPGGPNSNDSVPDLSTITGIIRGIGGFIQVESTSGVGTEFILHLPALIPEPEAADLALAPSFQATIGRGETVLLIEEDTDRRQIVQAFLETHGYRVICARDGAAALALFHERHKDVQIILSDPTMPGAECVNTLIQIRNAKPGVRIVAMGCPGPECEVQGLVGGVAFLPRPLTGEALLAAMRQEPVTTQAG